jgi:hypothetical protein
MKNSFRFKKFEDFEIVDEKQHVVGNLRVKPNSLLWAPLDAKVWYKIDLDVFERFAKRKGTKQKK